jgi:NAD(P)-dependent dehydrogenase (short-subunit alcohol dehydrogenase family)
MSLAGLRIFDGAVAIVTGAASGIGRALSAELARRGATTVLADVEAEVKDAAAGIACTPGRSASACTLDVTDFASVATLVQRVAVEHGRLDFMFNNAGIAAGGELRDHTIDAWNRIIDVNLRGVVHGVQAAYPLMLRQGFGHIVNTASMQGLMPSPLTASYSATKHALVGLSKALRVEAAAAGVRASVLCPGVIRTPLLAGGKHGIFVAAIPQQEQRDRALRFFERFRPMDVGRFAAQALDQVARNRAIIVLPAWWKLFWWLDRLSPALSLFIAERAFESARRDLFGAARHGPLDGPDHER